MMQRMHRSHLGIQGCLRRGREVMYWPRMNEEVKEFVSRCEVCRVYQDKQQKEPMIGHGIPSRPWQKVGSDLFELQNGHYLACVDYYSDFIEVDKIYEKKGKSVISKLKSQFARHGIPINLSVTMVHLTILKSLQSLAKNTSLSIQPALQDIHNQTGKQRMQ